MHGVKDSHEARADIDLGHRFTVDGQLEPLATGKVLIAILASAVEPATPIEIKPEPADTYSHNPILLGNRSSSQGLKMGDEDPFPNPLTLFIR
jgi:hypothetical protein